MNEQQKFIKETKEVFEEAIEGYKEHIETNLKIIENIKSIDDKYIKNNLNLENDEPEYSLDIVSKFHTIERFFDFVEILKEAKDLEKVKNYFIVNLENNIKRLEEYIRVTEEDIKKLEEKDK